MLLVCGEDDQNVPAVEIADDVSTHTDVNTFITSCTIYIMILKLKCY